MKISGEAKEYKHSYKPDTPKITAYIFHIKIIFIKFFYHDYNREYAEYNKP